jgi:hypothetical protein
MAELIEGHVRFHVLSPEQGTLSSRLEAAEDLISRVLRDISIRGGCMTVVNQDETRASLGEVAEAGIHLPEPTDALSRGSLEEHQDHEHERGLDLV